MKDSLIRNVDKCYVYVSDGTVMSISKRRRALKPDEKLYECEVFGFNNATKLWYLDQFFKENYPELFEGTVVAKSYGSTFRALSDKNGIIERNINGIDYGLYVNFVGGIELERIDKDKIKEEQKRKDDYKKNIVNTFYAPSINAILKKYGLKYDEEKGGIVFSVKSLNIFLRNIFENNLVKELSELGIEVKINDKLTAESSQGTYLRKVVYKKDMKILENE